MPFVLPYKYSYLFGTLVFFVPWLLLFLHRRDLRNEMLVMSIICAVGSFVTAYLWWTVDWWRPETITNTVIGVEDLLLGFTNGGIAAVIYQEMFTLRSSRKKIRQEPYVLSELLIFVFIFMSVLFYVIGFTSFISYTIAFTVAAAGIVIIRKDLLVNSLVSGILMALVSVPVYLLCILFSPGIVENTWLFEHLSGILILGIPMEDIIFYFLMGCVVGPFYEAWCGYKLRAK